MLDSPDVTDTVEPLCCTTDVQAPAPVDLLAVGQLFLDVLYGPLPAGPVLGQEIFTEQVTLIPGGIANFAAAAAALGARAAVSASIGDGPLSALTRSLLVDAGIGTEPLVTESGWDLQLTTALSYDGERALVTGGPPPVLGPSIPTGLEDAAAVAVHLDLADMPWIEHATGRVFADVGWDATGAWDRAMLRHLGHCYAFMPNAAEAQAYTRTDDPRTAAHALADLVPLVVVTCGADGAIAVDSATGTEVSVGALDLGPVDPTGAGDTFGASLIVLLERELPLRHAMEAACLAATVRATGLGGPGRTPGLAQLAALARRHGLGCADALVPLIGSSQARRPRGHPLTSP